MKRIALAALVFAFALPARSAAHQLDEYLQATRVSLVRSRLALEIALTPGATVAAEVIALLDRDKDGTISPIEAAAYGQLVLGDLIVKLDEHPVAMTLAHVEIAPIDALRSGIGTIQLRMASDFEATVTGRHQVYVRNNHQPGIGVYLVNALVPEDRDVRVMGQTRNPSQQEVRIDYDGGPKSTTQILWLVFGMTGLLTLMMVRTGRFRL